MPPKDSLIGHQLANFHIERLLGRGGMATIYAGRDVKLQRPVAIKIIDARYQDDPAFAQRFVNEARTIATWRHENILQVYYADDENGLYYFVMEYIRGPNLEQVIADYGAAGELMPHEDVLRIGRAIAGALDYAHERGVIHRDVKPANVMVAEDGRVILADFGLALDTAQGTVGEVFGSPHYIAPEQAKNSANAVPQSDLYSLGIILYELLTGSVPFDDPSPMSLAIQHITLPPPPARQFNANLNAKAEAVLLKALHKSSQERFQSGGELLDALEAALEEVETPAAQSIELPPPPAGTPPLTLSRVTVAERLAAYMEARPPTPDFSAPPPTPPRDSQPDKSRLPIWLGAGGCTALLLLGAFAVIVGLVIAFTRRDTPDQIAQTTPSPTLVLSQAEQPAPSTSTPDSDFSPNASTASAVETSVSLPKTKNTNTPLPTASETPTPTLPTPPTGTPTPKTAVYELLIMGRKEDSLVIVNQSEAPFPLASLRLEGKDDAVLLGLEWGLENLQPGECVYAVKDNKSKLPEVECQEVGDRLPRENKERFWKHEFEIYFDGEFVKSCQGEKEKDGCSVIIEIN
jgi:serine/threonine protein kinase